MVTSSNDWTVRLNDVRMLSAAAPDSKGVCAWSLHHLFWHVLHAQIWISLIA